MFADSQRREDMQARTVAETRVPKLIERIKAEHSYDCPCIVCVPVSAGNPDFFEWIGRSVAPG